MHLRFVSVGYGCFCFVLFFVCLVVFFVFFFCFVFFLFVCVFVCLFFLGVLFMCCGHKTLLKKYQAGDKTYTAFLCIFILYNSTNLLFCVGIIGNDLCCAVKSTYSKKT